MQTKLIINSKQINTENYQKVLSVADNSVIGEIALANSVQMDEAYVSAKNSFQTWKDISIYERSEILKKVANELFSQKEEFATLLSHEVGKPLGSARDEIERSVEFIITTCEIAKGLEGRLLNSGMVKGYKQSQKLSLVERIPLGVILCISPFNYPINLSVSKIAPALIAGNSVVFKPATQGSLVAFKLAEIFTKYLPTGVLNFVTGRGSEIGDLLIQNDTLDLVNFTGSTEVGKHIYSILAESSKDKIGFKMPLMELGGKDVAIVTSKADIQKAVKEIMKGAFSYSGQRCTAVKKVLVQESVYEIFVNMLQVETAKLKTGSPFDENVVITPLITKQAADYAEELYNQTIDSGMVSIREFERTGNMIHPNILVSNKILDLEQLRKIRIFDEEQFAPILPIFKFTDINSAIEIANISKYGLQNDVFTQDINEAFEIANHLDAATIQINGKSDRGPDNFPFAGAKNSGVGAQGIKDAIESMSKLKQVVINL